MNAPAESYILNAAERRELRAIADVTHSGSWTYRTNGRLLSALYEAGYVEFRDAQDKTGRWYRRYQVTAAGLEALEYIAA